MTDGTARIWEEVQQTASRVAHILGIELSIAYEYNERAKRVCHKFKPEEESDVCWEIKNKRGDTYTFGTSIRAGGIMPIGDWFIDDTKEDYLINDLETGNDIAQYLQQRCGFDVLPDISKIQDCEVTVTFKSFGIDPNATRLAVLEAIKKDLVTVIDLQHLADDMNIQIIVTPKIIITPEEV